MILRSCILGSAYALLSIPLLAATISVNFVGGTNDNPTSNDGGRVLNQTAGIGAIAGSQVGNWNDLFGNTVAEMGSYVTGATTTFGAGRYSPTDLVDSNGLATTADITGVLADGTYRTISTPTNATEAMYRGWLYTNSTSAQTQITIENIPYASYEVIVYFEADAATRVGRVTLNNNLADARYGASTGTVTALNAGGASYATTAANYAYFTGLSGSTLTIDLDRVDSNGNLVVPSTGLAGFQIIQVPEPSAALLGGLGMLVLSRRRRSK